MSKISEKKAEMGYRTTLDCCATCAHYSSALNEKTCQAYPGNTMTWTEEKEIRCTLGGFKTRKTAVCNHFMSKELTEKPTRKQAIDAALNQEPT